MRMNNSTSNGTFGLSWETEHIEIKLALCAILLVLSFVSNTTILLPLIRFTTTRTVTNIFIANLAVSDLITSFLNLPLFALTIVCDLSSLHNKTASWWIYCSIVFFGTNRVLCMVLLVVDQYFSVAHGLKYKLWKTTSIAKRICCLTWIGALTLTLSNNILNYHIDIGNVSSALYMKLYYRKSSITFVLLPLIVIAFTVLAILTIKAVKRKKKVLGNKNVCNTKTVRAAKTIFIVILIYFLCYLPMIIHAIASKKVDLSSFHWLKFFANYFFYLGNTANGFTYLTRSERFRRVLRQSMKCGAKFPPPIPTKHLHRQRNVFGVKKQTTVKPAVICTNIKHFCPD